MAQSNWEADKMLDVYIHDYLLKRNLHASAKAFMNEGKVATDPVAIDAPGGFLFEWWSVFWDIFIARTNEKHSEPAAAYIESQQIKAREQQQRQLQLMQQRNAQLQGRDPKHPAFGGSMTALNTDGVMGQPSTSVLAMKAYEERMKNSHSMDAERPSALMDAGKMALLNAHQSQLVQGNPGNIPMALQEMRGRTPLATDIKSEVNIGANQKGLPGDPSPFNGQAYLQPKSGPGSGGPNPGVSAGIPLRGWPLTGIDEFRPNVACQSQKPNVHGQTVLLPASQQLQQLAQAQSQSNPGKSTGSGDQFGQLPKGNLTRDGQSARNDGPICSPTHSSSPKIRTPQIQMPSQQGQLQQRQQQPHLSQNNRKRRQHPSSGPANSTGTGNTSAPSNSPPSTHTPSDGMTIMSKNLIHGQEGSGAVPSSSDVLEPMERFGDIPSIDDNMLSNEGGGGSNVYGTSKQKPIGRKASSKEFSFAEVGCIRTRNSKVTCCHFSSDGKLLASAGHDKKVVLWNMDTLQSKISADEHQTVITDVRFRPKSSQLATSSVDKTVRLWDAANPDYSLRHITGHNSPVMSLDFHPTKTDLFCFCDNDDEIHYWNIYTFSCTRVFKGGTAQVRFQPGIGQFLAAASDRVVSIFDVETDRPVYRLQGHEELVNYICWDTDGEYLASVSLNLVKIWSMNSGECIRELVPSGNQFHSCVFHPTYRALLIVGGISSLELWNFADNKSMTMAAHENIISALAQSPAREIVASASHDCSVKLWS